VSELARWRAIIINKYGDSPEVSLIRNAFQLPPIQAGTSTECPKLEIGNNSEKP
jgi:hypothetical protein